MRKYIEQFLSKYFQQHRLIPIGYVTPVCPYCMRSLKKKPSRKKKCPYCNKIIYVRTRPLDRQKVLITESQISLIEEQWSIANGTHKEYLEIQRVLEAERDKLAIRFGCE